MAKPGLLSLPGPVPISFFLDIPSNARAAFSTLDGQRPLRRSPSYTSPYCVRSDDDYTIHQRALSLLQSQPNIANSVTKHLVAWQDLYEYFDAYDLWIESPGVLFQVIGRIARINTARDKEIDLYAAEWVNTNSARLTELHKDEDVISSVFTEEDEQFFDCALLTSYEKHLLAKSLNRMCHFLNHPDALRVPKQRRQQQWSEGSYRSNRHYSHQTVPEAREPSPQVSPPVYPGRRARTKGDHLQQNFNLRRKNICSNSHSWSSNYAGEEEYTLSSKFHSDSKFLAGRLGPIPDPRNDTFITHPAAIHPEPHLGFDVYYPQPVYTMTPNIPHVPMNVHGPFGVSYNPLPPYVTHQSPPPYSTAEYINVGDREQAVTHYNMAPKLPNAHLEGPNTMLIQFANDSPIFTFRQARGVAPNKQLKYFNPSTEYRTVWIGCLSPHVLMHDFDRVLSVFSQCGNIDQWKALPEKFCAFITFEDSSSADRAVDSLNRYELEEGRFLKVERPRKRRLKERQNSITIFEENGHVNRRQYSVNETGSPFQGKKVVVRRRSTSNIHEESNGIEREATDIPTFDNRVRVPRTNQANKTSIVRRSSSAHSTSPLKRMKCKDTIHNNQNPRKCSNSKKKKKKIQNLRSGTSVPNSLLTNNAESLDNSLLTRGDSNGAKQVTSSTLDSVLFGGDSGSKHVVKRNSNYKDHASRVSFKALNTGKIEEPPGGAVAFSYTPEFDEKTASKLSNFPGIDYCDQTAHGNVQIQGETTIQSVQSNWLSDTDIVESVSKKASKSPKPLGQKVNNDESTDISIRKTDSASKLYKKESAFTKKGFISSGTFKKSPSSKSSIFNNRKENKEVSPKLLLSDLTQWPVLGSGKPLAETNPVLNTIPTMKPLSEHLPRSKLLRRGSTVSVLSTSPISCRPTNDEAGSPTGASELWPIVKRWDKHPRVYQNKCT